MQPSFVSRLVWAVTFLSSTAAAGPYSGYDISTLIPFLDQTNPTFSNTLHVNLRVGSTTGDKFTPFIDTGSTGIVLPGKDIAGFSQNHCTSANRGFHYLTSSNILYLGCWITKDLYFNVGDASHPVVHSRVPILAVYRRIQCHKDTDDLVVIATGDCPVKVTTKDDPSCHGSNPTCFGIMGIGWGRLDDGQPQATSDKNPLINVINIAVSGFDIARLYKGFIIHRGGITVGLTDGNTMGIDFTDLTEHLDQSTTPGGPGSGGTRNWNLLPACIWFGTEDPATDDCQEVSALLDTGIPQSYFRIPTTSGHVPPRDAGTLDVTYNTPVTVSFKKSTASTWHPVRPAESFKVGVFATPPNDKHDVTPSYMRAYRKNGYVVPNFFNSGMHLFRKYEICHDAQLGKVGFRAW
ncbi:hypothetical protein B0I37DRAFT_319238 [Chaetomium sp. MPI-CAGE-AT-0009]|nr:hypothetical protein B0I37DRAFT_319238 [Chaetomium sp. MPI-CAGE-AT-0009]